MRLPAIAAAAVVAAAAAVGVVEAAADAGGDAMGAINPNLFIHAANILLLDTYLAAHPETRIVLEQQLARDLAEKLQRVTADSLAGRPSATDPQSAKPPRYSA